MQAKLRRFVIVAMDAALICVAYILAYYLRLGGDGLEQSAEVIARTLPVLLAISLVVHLRFGLFDSLLRYASLDTAVAVLKSVSLSVLLTAMVLFVLNRLEGIPRTVFFIYGMAALILIGGGRLAFRWRRRFVRQGRADRRIVLYGVADTTEWVLRGLEVSPEGSVEAVGLIDDDPLKHGRHVLGVKIHGGLGILPDVVAETGAEELWVAIPDLVGERLRRVYNAATKLDLKVKVLSAANGLLEADLAHFHEPEIADLLRRPPRSLDRERMRRWIEGRRVLITGAGGSIGSELARQVGRLEPAALSVCDACEYNLFRVHGELERELGAMVGSPFLVDVRDEPGVRRMFAEARPEIVFHAAAYKHVPLVELNPCEGVLVNVQGLYNVARCAAETGCADFVFISTDKAVRPANVMGATKRLGETIIQALDRSSGTSFSAVRFGNVLGSSGSVVPIFQDQIRAGGPVTVTHPEMTRFFMLVSEAVELVTQAGSIGRGGEVFVLDMGQPVRIADMARDLIRLMGKEPDVDVKVVFSGLRPGEKIHEELLIDDRDSRTPFEDIWVDGETSGRWDWKELEIELQSLFAAAARRDANAVVSLLRRLVPSFRPAYEGTRALARPERSGAEVVHDAELVLVDGKSGAALPEAVPAAEAGI